MKNKNFIQKAIWRLKYKKVLYDKSTDEGRCINCDAGNPTVVCGIYYCPCNWNEHLKLK